MMDTLEKRNMLVLHNSHLMWQHVLLVPKVLDFFSNVASLVILNKTHLMIRRDA